VTGATIQAENLGIRFLFDRHRRQLTPTLARARRTMIEAWGLRGVNLDLQAGARVALFGPSAAGKTTLLRTIAGVLRPDKGRLIVDGRVGSLLSIEAGLLPMLTGRENATLLGVLAGLSRAESRARLSTVADVSGLGDAFERPVATFSQGMRARLGLAVMEGTSPDILLLDEVHEALDEQYREFLEQRVHRLAGEGGIVVAAGHDGAMLERLCDRALLLENGAVVSAGSFADVRETYLASTGADF
jgi:ABC-type polysaccharide/polyol phosphate transport system ATPase subunit